jgi:hypothetical protein
MAVTHEGPTEISGALRTSLKYSRYGAPFRGRIHRRVTWLRARDARRLAARGTACVALAAAVWLLIAAPGLAARRSCYWPRVRGADTIVAWNMTCTSARRVARAWVAAHYRYGGYNRMVLGFRCRTRSDSVEGKVTTCRRGSKRLQFYPSVRP